MFDVNSGPSESGSPDEGGGSASESVSEQAREQSRAASQAAAKAQAQQEAKAKKRDDKVAAAILQFLTDDQRIHLSTLIARLVARDCPSSFLLALLSLINEQCMQEVRQYLQDRSEETDAGAVEKSVEIARQGGLQQAGQPLIEWIARLDMVLSLDREAILKAIVLEGASVDGTVLQLTTFVLEEHLKSTGRDAAFEDVQGLAVGILQSLLEPHVLALQRQLEEQQAQKSD